MAKPKTSIRVIVRPRDLQLAEHIYVVTTSSHPASRRWKSTFNRIVNAQVKLADSIFAAGWRSVLCERII